MTLRYIAWPNFSLVTEQLVQTITSLHLPTAPPYPSLQPTPTHIAAPINQSPVHATQLVSLYLYPPQPAQVLCPPPPPPPPGERGSVSQTRAWSVGPFPRVCNSLSCKSINCKSSVPNQCDFFSQSPSLYPQPVPLITSVCPSISLLTSACLSSACPFITLCTSVSPYSPLSACPSISLPSTACSGTGCPPVCFFICCPPLSTSACSCPPLSVCQTPTLPVQQRVRPHHHQWV